MKSLFYAALIVLPLGAREPLAKQIVHTRPGDIPADARRCTAGRGNLITRHCWMPTRLIRTFSSSTGAFCNRRAESARTSIINARKCL